MENYIFWSEIGSGFEEPGGTPPSRIARSIPRAQTQEENRLKFQVKLLFYEVKRQKVRGLHDIYLSQSLLNMKT